MIKEKLSNDNIITTTKKYSPTPKWVIFGFTLVEYSEDLNKESLLLFTNFFIHMKSIY